MASRHTRQSPQDGSARLRIYFLVNDLNQQGGFRKPATNVAFGIAACHRTGSLETVLPTLRLEV